MNLVKLGYEIGSGKEIKISPSHLIVTGATQKAGKTTTLESLIMRSGKKAIVFRTKIGEKSFLNGTVIPPYFKDRSDWQFIQGLIEATIKERLRSFERAKIIQLCKQSGENSLLDFKKKLDQRLLEPKLNNFEKDILTNVQAYLDIVIPKLQTIQFSKELNLVEGLNIIDLERFSRDVEVQSLIIRSVLEEVLYNYKDVIVVIPECWKFIPQDRGSPCKLIVEEFIRQGATNRNFIWLDSQDMAGVDKTPLKQITEWILGYQPEFNEVNHTLKQIPLPKSQKPKAEDIMSLGTGIFYYATREFTTRVYIQPFWLDDEKSKDVALGKLDITKLDAPQTITPYAIMPQTADTQKTTPDYTNLAKRFNNELTETNKNFFDKIADIQQQINKIVAELYIIKSADQQIDEDAILRKILQKIPTQTSTQPIFDKESLIKEIINHLPKQTGNVIYEVEPLEKIRKDFLIEAKNKIISDVGSLSDDAKRLLKYLEVKQKGVKGSELCQKCFFMEPTGPNYTKMKNLANELSNKDLGEYDKPHQTYFGRLDQRIKSLLENHDAKPEEIKSIYDHVLMEMLTSGAKS